MSRQPVFEYHAKSIKIPLELPNGQNQIIQIESGYAFGTGNHFTTKLCLEMIQTLYIERSFKNVFDVGCGSGPDARCSFGYGSRDHRCRLPAQTPAARGLCDRLRRHLPAPSRALP